MGLNLNQVRSNNPGYLIATGDLMYGLRGSTDGAPNFGELNQFLLGTWVNPKMPPFNAKGDVKEVNDAAISGNVLTSATQPFLSTDVGKSIAIVNAGPSGIPFVDTIAGFTNAGSVTTTNAAPNSTSAAECQWGTDDTAALQAALDAVVPILSANAANRNFGGTVILPPGVYWTTGIRQHGRTMLQGYGHFSSILRLFPMSAGPVWHNYNTGGHDDFMRASSFQMDGNRNFQSITSTTGHGWVLNNAVGGYAYGDNHSIFDNLMAINCRPDGYRLEGGQGEYHFVNNIAMICSGHGIYWSTFDTHMVNCSSGGTGKNAFHFTSSCAGVRVANCKGFFSGTSAGNQGDGACWYVDGDACEFVNCRGEESWAATWYIIGRRHLFNGCLAMDAGDIKPADGLGGALPAVRSSWYLDGGGAGQCLDNNFVNCCAGMNVKPVNYATSAVYMIGNADYNRGQFLTQARTRTAGDGGNGAPPLTWNSFNSLPYQKAVDANAGGVLNNTFTIDGTPIT